MTGDLTKKSDRTRGIINRKAERSKRRCEMRGIPSTLHGDSASDQLNEHLTDSRSRTAWHAAEVDHFALHGSKLRGPSDRRWLAASVFLDTESFKHRKQRKHSKINSKKRDSVMIRELLAPQSDYPRTGDLGLGA
jgi:hypothetical protein